MPATNVNWMPPLIRLNPWYPGQMGVPGTDSETGLRTDSNGTVFYVDPNAVGVSDQRDGTDPNEPLATVAAALTHCQAYRNDVIAIAPNSLWTYGNTAVGRATAITEQVTVSVPGVRIVGLSPSGALGVNWTFTADNQTAITVNAMDVLIEGISFWNGGFNGTVGIYTDWNAPPYGENLTVRNCFFYATAYGIRLDYAWNCYIENNVFQDIGTAAINSVDTHGDPDYLTIINNTFTGCAAAIDLEDTGDCIIHGNRIVGDATGTNNYIDLTGGATNLVSDNWLGCTVAQYDVTCSDGTSGAWVNNHCIDGDPVANPV